MSNLTSEHKQSAVLSGPLTAQTDIARYSAWDAMRRATPNRDAIRVWAEELRCSESLIEKGRRPHGGRTDTGRASFPYRLWRAEHRCVTEAHVPLMDAVATLDWHARKHGFRLVPRGAAVETDPNVVTPALIRTASELSAFLVEALADDHLDVLERQGIRDRMQVHIEMFLSVEAMAEVEVA